MACERSHRSFSLRVVGGPSCSKGQHLFRQFYGILTGGRGQMVLSVPLGGNLWILKVQLNSSDDCEQKEKKIVVGGTGSFS